MAGALVEYHPLSAADTCLLVPSGLQSHGRDLLPSAAQTICVIDAVWRVGGRGGTRTSRAPPLYKKGQRQSSPLWLQWAGPRPIFFKSSVVNVLHVTHHVINRARHAH